MSASISEYKEELMQQIEGLPAEKVKEILDFAYFVRAKDAIDPSQVYFWTTRWQMMEVDADKDRESGNVIGNGTVDGLLTELRK